MNKRQRKPKGKSRIDNPETLATFGQTSDTGRRNGKDTQKTHTKQKTKKMGNTDPQKLWVNAGAREG